MIDTLLQYFRRIPTSQYFIIIIWHISAACEAGILLEDYTSTARSSFVFFLPEIPLWLCIHMKIRWLCKIYSREGFHAVYLFASSENIS